MTRRIDHGGPRLKSGTKATEDADGPWLDDKTTTKYIRTPATPKGARPEGASPEEPENAHSSQQQDQRAGISSAGAKPSWLRVFALSTAVAVSLLIAQVLWAAHWAEAKAPAATAPNQPAVSAATVDLAPQPSAADSTPLAAATGHDAAIAASTQPVVHTKPKNAARTLSKLGKSRDRAERRAKARSHSAATDTQPEHGRFATLNINSQPWSEVSIDTMPLGPTPLLGISLTPGTHMVRLYSREHNVLKILTLHVLPGEVIDRIESLDPAQR